MKSTTPSYTVVTCDLCGKTDDNKALFRTGAHLEIDRAGLDYQGAPVGPGGTSLDACDSCIYAVEEAIKQIAKDKKSK